MFRVCLADGLGWAVSAIGFLFAFKTVSDLDFWWHLATGRWIVQNHSFVTQDMMSFTYPGSPWTDITWGFEVLQYLLFSWAGDYWPITLLLALISSATVFVAWRSFLKVCPNPSSAGVFAAFVVFLFGMSIAELRWINRPEQLTHFYGAVTLYILLDDWSRFRKGEKPSWALAWLPVIEILWVNTHGLFILGPALVGFFLAAKLLFRRSIQREPLALVFSGVLFGTLLNPRGWIGATFPFHLWQVLNHPFYRTTIPEATNPLKDSVWGFDVTGFVIYAALTLLSLLIPARWASPKNKWKDFCPAYYVLAFVLIWFSVLARRNIALFIVWTIPWVGAFVARQVGERFQARPFVAGLGAAGLGAILSLALVTNVYRPEGSAYRFGGGLSPHEHPVRAADFLKGLPRNPKLFSGVQFADVMLFLDPKFKSYIDGRFAEMYPREHFQRYMDVLAHPWLIEEEVKRYGLDGAALEIGNPMTHGLISYLATQSRWEAVFIDETCLVFLIADKASQIRSTGQTFQSVESMARERTADMTDPRGLTKLAGTLTILMRADLAAPVIQRIFNRWPDYHPAFSLKCIDDYMALERRANELLKGGQTDLERHLAGPIADVERACLGAIKTGYDVKSAQFTLGLLYLNLGRMNQAASAFREVIRWDPLNYQSYLLLGRVSAKGAREGLEGAEKAYLEAARLRPYDPTPFVELSRAMEVAGNKDRAQSYLFEARRRAEGSKQRE